MHAMVACCLRATAALALLPRVAPTVAAPEPAIQGFSPLGVGACRGAGTTEPARCTRFNERLYNYTFCANQCADEPECNAYMHDSTRGFCIIYTDAACPAGMARAGEPNFQPVTRANGEEFWFCYGRDAPRTVTQLFTLTATSTTRTVTPERLI